MKGKWINITRRVAGITALIVIFVYVSKGLNFLFVNEFDWCRIFWHNYYKHEGEIDSICLGSSHVYTTINPYVLDEISGEYNYNMATNGQLANGSYYLLKEATSANDISHVYFELFYRFLTKETYNNNIDPMVSTDYLSHNQGNTDHMKLSLNRLMYLKSVLTKENCIEVLLPFTRYRSSLGDWHSIKLNISRKNADTYKAFQWNSKAAIGGTIEFQDKGYCYYDGEYLDEERLLKQVKILEENPLGEQSEEYIRKVIAHCQKENIPITLFISPVDNV